jgi:hypothetical protein
MYDRVRRECAFRARTVAGLKTWQRRLRARLGAALGLTSMEKDLAGHRPRAERASSADVGDYVRERWYLWVEPDVPLPLWVLLPKGRRRRRPLVLTPHGHTHPNAYVGLPRNHEEVPADDPGQGGPAVDAVREGYVTIAPTVRGFGETARAEDLAEGKNSSCRVQLMHGLLVGRTPIGERVWDVSRVIDWALAQFAVDPKRIAVTGNSGGGTVSLFAGAMDERITVTVPSCSFSTFAGSIGSIAHCDCNYVPGILQLGEMYEVAGLIAPRAFCALTGREDASFPIEEAKKAFDQLQHIYAVAGAPARKAGTRCELYVGGGGHRYYGEGAWPFIRKYFRRAPRA